MSVVNESSDPLIATGCFVLQLREQGAWKTISSTHGTSVLCTTNYSAPAQAARSKRNLPLMLYDDLPPGRYRITLRYKFLPKHWRAASLNGNLRRVYAALTVLAFRPGPAPHLPEQRIRRIALGVARGAGDPHPSLIQHAEGTRYEANWVAAQTQIFDWSWAYLVAIRGRFGAFGGAPGSLGHSYAVERRASCCSVITLVLNANTGRIEDLGAGSRSPALSRLGPVTTDYRNP